MNLLNLFQDNDDDSDEFMWRTEKDTDGAMKHLIKNYIVYTYNVYVYYIHIYTHTEIFINFFMKLENKMFLFPFLNM